MKETRTVRKTNDLRERGSSPVVIHAVLALLALTAAYLAWTRDKSQIAKATEVPVYEAGKRDVSSVTYQDEHRTVTVERKNDISGDSYAWVTVTTKSKTLTTPSGAPPAAPSSAISDPHGAPPPAPAKPATETKAPADRSPQKGGDKAAAGKEGEKAPSAAPAAADKPKPTTETAPATTPPAATTPAPAPVHEIKEVVTVKAFRGSETGDKLLEAFGPLMALRALGALDDAKAKELGLTDSKKTLTIQVKDRPVKLTIGNTSYGAGDIYVRDERGQVFLLASRFSSDFEYAESRLMERRLHRFERQDLSRVEVTVGNKKKVLVQQKRLDPVGYYWAEEATPDKRDDTLRNWMDKVLRMAISDYVAKGEEPKPPEVNQSQAPGVPASGEVLSMRFYDGRKQIGQATFSRYPKGPTTEYYATTETTIGLVRLLSATAESAIQDAEKW